MCLRWISVRQWLTPLRPFALLGVGLGAELATGGAGNPALAQERAQIRINSPFAAPFWRADVDAAGRIAVTSGANKSLAIWPLDRPGKPEIERLPIVEDQQKRAHAIAVSPDGRFIAYSRPPLIDTAGNFKSERAAIYIIEVKPAGGRRIVKVLSSVDDDIVTRPQGLKFSPDGKFLAAVLSSACGLRVWSTSDWLPVFKDDLGYGSADPGLQNEDTCCRSSDPDACEAYPDGNSVVFRSQGSSVSILTSSDKGIRSYAQDADGGFKRSSEFASPASLGIDRIGGIALNAKGDALAVGDRRSLTDDPARYGEPLEFKVALVDPASLKPLPAGPLVVTADDVQDPKYLERGRHTQDVTTQASLDRVAWIENERGSFVVAAGALPCRIIKDDRLALPREGGKQELCMARWAPGQGARFIPFGADRVMDVVAVPGSGGVLAVSQRLVSVIDENGAATGANDGLEAGENAFADMRDINPRSRKLDFKISPDANIVEIESHPGADDKTVRLTFKLADRRMTVQEGDSAGAAVVVADQDPGEKVIKKWRNARREPPLVMGLSPEGDIFGKDEIFRSMALVPGRKALVLGSSEALRVIDYEDGRPQVICKHRIREDAYRINVTENGKTVVSAHSDGSIRWFRIEQGEAGTCALVPVLAAVLLKGEDGAWFSTAWIPSGDNTGRFTRTAFKSDNLLVWQCTGSDGQIKITPFLKMTSLISFPAVYSALVPDAEAPKPLIGLDKLTSCASGEIAEKAERPPVLKVDEPRRPEVDAVQLPVVLVMAPDAPWPKRLTARISSTNERLVIRYKDAPQNAMGGLMIEPSMVNPESGLLEIALELPESIRQVRGQVSAVSLQLGDEQTALVPVKWLGEPAAKTRKRRLWAVVIGMSKHEADSRMDLRFAENDALDMAGVFLGDYVERVVKKTSDLPADFDAVHVKLIVSPFSKGAAGELEALVKANPESIQTYQPTVAGVNEALLSVEEGIAADPDYDDVMLFHFSGHGMISPESDAAESLFATTETVSNATPENLRETTFSTTTLLANFDRITAQKLVILDACRTLPPVSGIERFDPERFHARFVEANQEDAHFYFASDVGNPAIEIEDVAYNASRDGRAGNSIFSYAFLKALTTVQQGATGPQSIDVSRVNDFLQKDFFNTAKPDSEINRLRPVIEVRHRHLPNPKILRAREIQPNETLRTVRP